MNKLFFGDNLDILKRYIADESIDLIYLDPPFNSKATYNVIFKESDSSRSASQIKAFEDTWRWDSGTARVYSDVIESGGQVARALLAYRQLLGENDMLAYLTMMTPRLVELHRVLKSTGSIYLHCDSTASHYLKILMDAVFGLKNFLNEIVWYYRGAGVPKMERARRHDTILWYAKKEGDHYFNPDPARRPYAEATVERFSHYIGNVRGEKDYGQQSLHPLGKHPDDVISDIQPIAPSAKERLSYPTQKPEELLAELISSTSKEGDLVLDPFCGCGTTISVAQRLNRRWVGIDVTHIAITLIKHRLVGSHGKDVEFETIGEPTSLPDAEALAEEDRFQFQVWALGLVGARPKKVEKGADKGIDGVIYFHEPPSPDTKKVIVSVKSGKPKATDVRDLAGVVEREKAQIGVLITLQPPTRPMIQDAAARGFYESPYGKHPKIQIYTIADLLSGKQIDRPATFTSDTTFTKAQKVKEEGRNLRLFED